MFGLGPIELIIAAIMFGGVGFVGWLVLRILVRAAYSSSPRKCPHCGKDIPG
jgi:hypothetical protein